MLDSIGRINQEDLMFLLGAGASIDAGLHAVAKLTGELRSRLPLLSDVNGITRPEFGLIFDFIEKHDPEISKNYERFFKWISLILDIRKDPFRKILKTEMDDSLIKVMGHLSFVIGNCISEILYSIKTAPEYLSKIADFLPSQGRLKVFSLNYDCCLEEACQANNIDVITGFDPVTKMWNPSLFLSKEKGINLYKLHGSLRWFGTRDESLSDDQFLCNHILRELKAEERNFLPSHIKVSPTPELILGPGSKIQPDDPFLTLFYEFHSSLQKAKICIIIGYGYQDEHVNSVLDHAVDRRVHIIDVNPGGPCSKYLADSCYHHLSLSAKNALMNGNILAEIKRLTI